MIEVGDIVKWDMSKGTCSCSTCQANRKKQFVVKRIFEDVPDFESPGEMAATRRTNPLAYTCAGITNGAETMNTSIEGLIIVRKASSYITRYI